MLTDPPDRRMTNQAVADYVLGYTDSEQERLIRQAAIIGPTPSVCSTRQVSDLASVFLDLGSGMGDVAMLLARIVGPSGAVVGVERDANSIADAQARVAAADFRNVKFLNTDVNNIVADQPFDAVVGRLILCFSLIQFPCCGPCFAWFVPVEYSPFQEPSWTPMLALGARLPLWSRTRHLIHETLLRSGANREMGLALYSRLSRSRDCLHRKCIWKCRWGVTRISSGLLLTSFAVCVR